MPKESRYKRAAIASSCLARKAHFDLHFTVKVAGCDVIT
jgi:hypothetical protein